ncbi:MAG: LysM domain-containing protein [Desulfosarcinaceae bacterium]
MRRTKQSLRMMPVAVVTGLLTLMFAFGPSAVSAAGQKTGKDVEYEAGFYYTIKPGDTLWDISQRFSDTPWQWPDLWSENEQIPNPHWIYPGERIRLYRKTEKDRQEIAQKEVPKITPQVEASTQPEKTAPEVHYFYSRMDRVGFIRKPPVKPNGVIFKVLDDKQLISIDDLVYLRNPQSGPVTDLTPGSRWTIYRPLAPTDDRLSKETIGTQHYLVGTLEVTRNEGEYAIAKVINSYRNIQVDDLIMPFKDSISEVAVSESTPGIDGKIIASEEHTKLIGEQVVAFIDKGEKDSVLPGQIYGIIEQETAKLGPGNSKTVTLEPVNIGSLIVLHTEQTTSTVLITDARRKITPNTRIRTMAD